MDADEARRRLSDPDGPAQQKLRRLKQRHWDETTLPASAVFAARLRETRKARGLTQAELAQRMKAKGHTISETALRRIESWKRGLSLDEAFALIEALEAVPVYMLTPQEDKLIRLSESVATDGEGMRGWLVSGLPDLIPPERRPEPPAELTDALAREQRTQENFARIRRVAYGLVDAVRDGVNGVDDKRTQRAWNALIVEAVRQKDREKDADTV